MIVIYNYLWLACEAFSMLLIIWPVGITMFIGTIGAIVSLQIMAEAARWKVVVCPIISAIIPTSVLLCGVLLPHNLRDGPAPLWPEYLIDGLLLTHLPLAVLLVWTLKGARWFTFCASLAVASYSCGAAVMSGMSVSGVWL